MVSTSKRKRTNTNNTTDKAETDGRTIKPVKRKRTKPTEPK